MSVYTYRETGITVSSKLRKVVSSLPSFHMFLHARYLILWEFLLLKNLLHFHYMRVCWQLDGESSEGGSKQHVFTYVSIS